VLLPTGKHTLRSHWSELCPAPTGQQLAASVWGHPQPCSPSEPAAVFSCVQPVVKAKCWCWTENAECTPVSVPRLPSLLLPAAFTTLTSFQLALLPKSHPVNHSLSHPQTGPQGTIGSMTMTLLGQCRALLGLHRNNRLICPDLTKPLEETVASSRSNSPQMASFLLVCKTRTIRGETAHSSREGN